MREGRALVQGVIMIEPVITMGLNPHGTSGGIWTVPQSYPIPTPFHEAWIFSNFLFPAVEGCSQGCQLPSASSQVESGRCLQDDFSRYLVGEGTGGMGTH